MIKHSLFIPIAIFALFTFSCNNNEPNDQNTENDLRPGKLYKSEKIGFFTEKMNLSEKEAQKFWPIYNTYSRKRDSLWRAQRHFLIDFNRNDTPKNNGSQALETFLLFQDKREQIRNDYINKLQTFMSDEKILTLFYTEHQFKHFILNRIRGRHGREHRPGRGMGPGQGRGRNNQPAPCAETMQSF